MPQEVGSRCKIRRRCNTSNNNNNNWHALTGKACSKTFSMELLQKEEREKEGKRQLVSGLSKSAFVAAAATEGQIINCKNAIRAMRSCSNSCCCCCCGCCLLLFLILNCNCFVDLIKTSNKANACAINVAATIGSSNNSKQHVAILMTKKKQKQK